jgi:hypothetical protein
VENPDDVLPDVRDGLTREERVILYVLHETQKECGSRNVPTAMLWGRVCEHFYISPLERVIAFLAILAMGRIAAQCPTLKPPGPLTIAGRTAST